MREESESRGRGSGRKRKRKSNELRKKTKSVGKTYHFGSAEVVDQIPQEWPMISVGIGRGTISS
jgi:hypothetical protein